MRTVTSPLTALAKLRSARKYLLGNVTQMMSDEAYKAFLDAEAILVTRNKAIAKEMRVKQADKTGL